MAERTAVTTGHDGQIDTASTSRGSVSARTDVALNSAPTVGSAVSAESHQGAALRRMSPVPDAPPHNGIIVLDGVQPESPHVTSSELPVEGALAIEVFDAARPQDGDAQPVSDRRQPGEPASPGEQATIAAAAGGDGAGDGKRPARDGGAGEGDMSSSDLKANKSRELKERIIAKAAFSEGESLSDLMLTSSSAMLAPVIDESAEFDFSMLIGEQINTLGSNITRDDPKLNEIVDAVALNEEIALFRTLAEYEQPDILDKHLELLSLLREQYRVDTRELVSEITMTGIAIAEACAREYTNSGMELKRKEGNDWIAVLQKIVDEKLELPLEATEPTSTAPPSETNPHDEAEDTRLTAGRVVSMGVLGKEYSKVLGEIGDWEEDVYIIQNRIPILKISRYDPGNLEHTKIKRSSEWAASALRHQVGQLPDIIQHEGSGVIKLNRQRVAVLSPLTDTEREEALELKKLKEGEKPKATIEHQVKKEQVATQIEDPVEARLGLVTMGDVIRDATSPDPGGNGVKGKDRILSGIAHIYEAAQHLMSRPGGRNGQPENVRIGGLEFTTVIGEPQIAIALDSLDQSVNETGTIWHIPDMGAYTVKLLRDLVADRKEQLASEVDESDATRRQFVSVEDVIRFARGEDKDHLGTRVITHIFTPAQTLMQQPDARGSLPPGFDIGGLEFTTVTGEPQIAATLDSLDKAIEGETGTIWSVPYVGEGIVTFLRGIVDKRKDRISERKTEWEEATAEAGRERARPREMQELGRLGWISADDVEGVPGLLNRTTYTKTLVLKHLFGLTRQELEAVGLKVAYVGQDTNNIYEDTEAVQHAGEEVSIAISLRNLKQSIRYHRIDELPRISRASVLFLQTVIGQRENEIAEANADKY